MQLQQTQNSLTRSC